MSTTRADHRTDPEQDDPQRAVARARARVLSGRGPGAPQAETDRYQRERASLGPLPAPLERELVHLRTAAYRSDAAEDLDETAVGHQRDRLLDIWAPPSAQAPRRGADRAPVGFAAGIVVGATVGLCALWLRSRRPGMRRWPPR